MIEKQQKNLQTLFCLLTQRYVSMKKKSTKIEDNKETKTYFVDIFCKMVSCSLLNSVFLDIS